MAGSSECRWQDTADQKLLRIAVDADGHVHDHVQGPDLVGEVVDPGQGQGPVHDLVGATPDQDLAVAHALDLGQGPVLVARAVLALLKTVALNRRKSRIKKMVLMTAMRWKESRWTVHVQGPIHVQGLAPSQDQNLEASLGLGLVQDRWSEVNPQKRSC